MTTQYQRGHAFELAVRRHLESEGYWCVRAAGSKTKADLIAIKPGQMLIVQCKRDGKISPAERTEVRRIASMINCAVPILAAKTRFVVQPALWQLTGDGPQDREPFQTDEAAA